MATSMRGKKIDMMALASLNENAIAITGGGLSMNARGDLLGPGGKVVKPVERIKEETITNNANKSKISLSDTKAMKKFALKRSFMTPEEIQEHLQEMENKKKKAKESAERLIEKTHLMASEGPIIKNIEDEDKEPKTNIKSKRKIIESDE